MNTKLLTLIFVCLCAFFSACGSEALLSSSDEAGELVLREASKTADPQGAVKAIYNSLENYKIEKLGQDGISEYYGLEAGDATEFFAYRSDPREGLCDLIIAKPLAYNRDKVRSCLYSYQNDRIKEFENYNILSSYETAQNAVVYDQGDYIIMLMFDDNEAIRSIIDEYIPQ